MHSHMVTSCRFFWGGLSLYMVWRTFSTQLDPPVYAYLIFWPHLIWLQNTLVSASNLIIGSWCFYIICSIADPLKQSNAVVHHYFCIQIYRFLSFRRLLSQQVTGDRPFSGIIRGCSQGTRGHRRILKPWSQRKRPGQFWEFLWEFSENWLVNPIMFLGKLPKNVEAPEMGKFLMQHDAWQFDPRVISQLPANQPVLCRWNWQDFQKHLTCCWLARCRFVRMFYSAFPDFLDKYHRSNLSPHNCWNPPEPL